MASIVCNGCGQTLDPGQSGGKPKMRCPGCGALVDLRDFSGYEAPKKSKPAPDPGEMRDEGSDESPFGDPVEAIVVTEKPKKRKAESADRPVRKKTVPTIDGKVAPPPFEPPQPEFETSNEDDGKAYAMPGGVDFPCPGCSDLLPRGTILCTRCGFDLRTGKKKKTTVKPISLHFGPKFSETNRMILWGLLGLQLVLPYLMGWISFSLDTIWLTVFAWILMAFILGTWGELSVDRKSNGRTLFTRRIRVGFVPLVPLTYSSDKYIGLKAELRGEVTMIDYIVMVALLGMFLIPGIIFYFTVFMRPEYAIILTGEHGMSLEQLYRSRDTKRTWDILEQIAKVSGLPSNG